MSTWKTPRRAVVRALTGALLTAALVAPAATALAATPAAHRSGVTVTAASVTASPWRTVKLVDGSTGKIYRLGAHHYRMEIVYRGAVYARLEANRHDAGVDANDMFVVLTFDGQVHSWIGGAHLGPGTFRLPDGSTAKVTRLGDRSRAQIVHRGKVYATLEAKQHDAGLDANGMFVVLTFDGQISASIR
ncbi:hypothetical protein ABT288_06005 [Streptomyces sp. NPDC001093]|uniref:hypothetical protein n=1 Tax=Streptomyces sp. NPDC001093 TaxID=3154376 RepID=UPI00332986D4